MEEMMSNRTMRCSDSEVQGGPKKVSHHQFFKKSY